MATNRFKNKHVYKIEGVNLQKKLVFSIILNSTRKCTQLKSVLNIFKELLDMNPIINFSPKYFFFVVFSRLTASRNLKFPILITVRCSSTFNQLFLFTSQLFSIYYNNECLLYKIHSFVI